MRFSPELTCIVCQLVFCCKDCRWRHEQATHDLSYDCPLCRGSRFLCQPHQLTPSFLIHLQEHLPLHCSKCEQVFTTMDDLADIDKCTSLSELVDHSKSSLKVADERFDSLYEKIIEGDEEKRGDEVERSNKTAVITPIVRKKYLVDYEASDTEPEDGDASPKVSFTGVAAPKTPRLKRSATPHVKKLLLARQQAVDESGRGSPDLDTESAESEMTTPNSRPQSLAAAALAVTTSTPTHAAAGGWALFSTQTDSPLSEIEQADSPQTDKTEVTEQTEPEQTGENTEQSGSKEPKLKSIISRRVGSAESSEDRPKRVKFADDTVFQAEPRVKRVFRKPKRMLTPGPTKARFSCNPRFQALLNRFEHNAAATSSSNSFSPHPNIMGRTYDTMARTPVNNRQEIEASVPRAIDFKDSPLELKNSPVVEENRDASFKSCVATPGGIDTAISALSTNIAGSLQTCITNVLKHTEEETEIQFKFTITKKKTVQRQETVGEAIRDQEKENLWATVAKAVKNAFWGEGGEFETPHKSISSCNSSSSKRKQPDRSRSPSPLSHKRGKYEPRLRGRPPLRQGLPLTARLAKDDVTSHSF